MQIYGSNGAIINRADMELDVRPGKLLRNFADKRRKRGPIIEHWAYEGEASDRSRSYRVLGTHGR